MERFARVAVICQGVYDAKGTGREELDRCIVEVGKVLESRTNDVRVLTIMALVWTAVEEVEEATAEKNRPKN